MSKFVAKKLDAEIINGEEWVFGEVSFHLFHYLQMVPDHEGRYAIEFPHDGFVYTHTDLEPIVEEVRSGWITFKINRQTAFARRTDS